MNCTDCAAPEKVCVGSKALEKDTLLSSEEIIFQTTMQCKVNKYMSCAEVILLYFYFAGVLTIFYTSQRQIFYLYFTTIVQKLELLKTANCDVRYKLTMSCIAQCATMQRIVSL